MASRIFTLICIIFEIHSKLTKPKKGMIMRESFSRNTSPQFGEIQSDLPPSKIKKKIKTEPKRGETLKKEKVTYQACHA